MCWFYGNGKWWVQVHWQNRLKDPLPKIYRWKWRQTWFIVFSFCYQLEYNWIPIGFVSRETNLALVKTFPFRPLITTIQSAVYKWISKNVIAIANIMCLGNVPTSNDLQNMFWGFFNYTLSRYFNTILVTLFYRWSLNLGKPFSWK